MWITKMVSCPLPEHSGLESKTDTQEENRQLTLTAWQKFGKMGSFFLFRCDCASGRFPTETLQPHH